MNTRLLLRLCHGNDWALETRRSDSSNQPRSCQNVVWSSCRFPPISFHSNHPSPTGGIFFSISSLPSSSASGREEEERRLEEHHHTPVLSVRPRAFRVAVVSVSGLTTWDDKEHLFLMSFRSWTCWPREIHYYVLLNHSSIGIDTLMRFLIVIF